ncbi:MAG: histidinol-phosphate transaminase, partial [Chitinophagaceae bacterium]
MAASLNRRAWIKRSALLAGGSSLLPSLWNGLSAAPAATGTRKFISDAEWARWAPPGLKARLFANENPFGPSAKAKQAIVEAMDTSYQYAFQLEEELRQLIAGQEGLNDDMVELGAGSSCLLHAAAAYYSRGGGAIITGDPTYDDLPETAEAFGANWVKVPLTADYKLDLDAMEKAVDGSTRLVYICNPNNPTGTTVDAARLRSFCENVSAKTMVFVDEAYIDYLPDPKAASMAGLVKNGTNIIVARTFSKLHGFAGLRVGYMMGRKDTL